jgi:MPBQ/MSBQ methyltransferase
MTGKTHRAEVVTYYEDTGLDYGEWSREFNMHFGYYRFPMNPFKREPMLDAMNQQVFDHLQLTAGDKLVYDLGCGLAAPCRAFARRFPGKKVKGVTIVKWQIEKACTLNKAALLDDSIEMVLGDYTKLPFEDNSADGVYALESACHCEGIDKADFVKEMMRVLKPGKRFVIVDGFIKKDPSKFSSLLRYCYLEICKGWALPSFPQLDLLCNVIKDNGGTQLKIKDFSFHVAPSVMHAPSTVIYFLIKKMLQGEKLNRVRLDHLKACLLGLVLGMHRHRFSYCLVTGIKAN